MPTGSLEEPQSDQPLSPLRPLFDITDRFLWETILWQVKQKKLTFPGKNYLLVPFGHLGSPGALLIAPVTCSA